MVPAAPGARSGLWLALIALLSPGPAHAGLIASFDLDVNAWRATDVVVVSEGAVIDGKVVVAEVWRGELAAGVELEFSDLAVFAPPERRDLTDLWWGHGRSSPPVREVTGARMVLFLVRDGASWRGVRADAPGRAGPISVAWIEEGEAYVLRQVVNPGGLYLVREASERAMRTRVEELTPLRQAYLDTIALDDPVRRVDALARFLDVTLARSDAIEALAACGEAAAPLLRDVVLAGEPREPFWEGMIALLRAGGAAALHDFAQLLDREADFWATEARWLEDGWWGGDGLAWDQAQRLRRRYRLADDALRVLHGRPDELLRGPIGRLRRAWEGVPGAPSQSLRAACDRLVDALDRAR
ncbi:MAG: hypothetical protein KF878_21800 [Planctomycetes bacterium]|nr:hypothetical protein [Planctomycetota bacterium]